MLLFLTGLPFPGREKHTSDAVYCNVNKRKLHEFPGFNAPPPVNSIDVSIFE